jgi:hypothetical protein
MSSNSFQELKEIASLFLKLGTIGFGIAILGFLLYKV